MFQSSSGWGSEVVESTLHGHPCLMYATRPRSLSDVLDASLRWSDRVFLVQGERRITFAQHHRAVQAVANRLREYGVGEGDRVALYAANSHEWVTTFFATIALGAVAVPCNGWWAGAELAHACGVVTPTVVVCDERRAERVPPELRRIALTDLVTDDVWDAPAAARLPNPADENAPAVVLFTAGTTGFPKGAVLAHRSLIANLQTLLVVSRKLPHEIADDAPESVTLVGLPLFHIGAIQLILVPLMTGGRVVFPAGRFDPEEVLRLIDREGVTMFSGVPTMADRLLRHPDAAGREYPTLRTVVLGGSPVSDELLERVSTTFPNSRRRVGRTYGLTEAGGVVSTGVGEQVAARPGTSGRLGPVVEVRISEPGADGEGEVLVRSPSSMDGYWGLPGDPTLDADGWIHTGDLGRLDDDRFLYITGRRKEVVIRGGENVSAVRVETVLHEHPDVAEVAVIGLPDPDLGEIVAAAVVPAAGAEPTAGELERWARASLAHFAVPSRWWIRAEPLPVNDAGKVVKARLAQEWPD
ncbi:class I adenylate-forming enzyme family protein [Cryptosporangium aurantiacum]|uniref:Long-chain acyl-CoA synthetase n=1 Tax=Cryptosporangium aurantiacum TaxID=134849 RepID=A0A1M7KGY5_9ACTN|nr:class I adenylate-forming enzyme family protein [Cryptosporangium aurantiacum]SHM64362.1 long-chain acyl-CoA synthetase [Cryptosporangium aurantiacum]